MRKSNLVFSLLIVVAMVVTAVAQAPATSTTTTGTTATGTTGNSEVAKTLEEILEEPAVTDTYRYDPQGRRDPFRSLIGPAPKLEPGQRRAGHQRGADPVVARDQGAASAQRQATQSNY